MPLRRGQPLDLERVARELVRVLRGKRSCAELSRRAGYRSNIVHRWEAGGCWPTVSTYLSLHRRFRKPKHSWITHYFHAQPAWARGLDDTSPAAVAAFLQALRGKTPILRIAELVGCNRYTVARWFDGATEPRLLDFLRVVQATSRRVVDLVAALEDPAQLPSLRARHLMQKLAREAAYEFPWSHAVLRGLELVDCPRERGAQLAFLAQKLGIEAERVQEALHVLKATAQVKESRGGFVPSDISTIDTGSDPARAHGLKLAWTKTALERLQRGAPGKFGWTVFAVSRADLGRLHALHLQYVRAMQGVVASSTPSDCVGLYCAQLLDLGE